MLGDLSGVAKIYLVSGYTDMRRSIDGLMAIVRDTYELDPYSNSLFLFCGKRCDRLMDKVMQISQIFFCAFVVIYDIKQIIIHLRIAFLKILIFFLFFDNFLFLVIVTCLLTADS